MDQRRAFTVSKDGFLYFTTDYYACIYIYVRVYVYILPVLTQSFVVIY